jgi:hypothetical protein
VNDPINPQRLAEIKACERETRDGPWTLADANDGDGTPPFWVVSTPEDTDDDWSVEVYVGDKAVGEFIAMARTAVPELLAEVDRLTQELADAREANQIMREAASRCTRRAPHPPHKWMLGRRLRECPGVAEHADQEGASDG